MSFITLGVAGLGRMARFYKQALKLRRLQTLPEVVFSGLGKHR